jgi:hypothetical protein
MAVICVTLRDFEIQFSRYTKNLSKNIWLILLSEIKFKATLLVMCSIDYVYSLLYTM